MLIVVQYVDNSGIRYNYRELVDEFYAAVRDDGRIDLDFVGGLTWWLGVRFTYHLATGAVSADQEAFIDKLLEQYTMTNCNPCVLPMAVGADLASIPLPDVPDKDIVAAYAKLVGRRQVFAPKHAVLCFVLQRRSVFMEISSRSYPRSLYK
jgi:hypothetical protein